MRYEVGDRPFLIVSPSVRLSAFALTSLSLASLGSSAPFPGGLTPIRPNPSARLFTAVPAFPGRPLSVGGPGDKSVLGEM